MNKHLVKWCSVCQNEICAKIIERESDFTFKGETFTTTERVPVCPKCGEELTDEKLDSELMKRLYDLYVERMQITSISKRNRDLFQKEQTVYYEDIKDIIKKVLNEGFSGDEMVEEIAYRIKSYNGFIDNRIKEFERDLRNKSESDLEGDFNGLDVFFKTETGGNVENA